MHSFLWSGKDSDGKTRAERVEAKNAQEARAILTSEGWTELQLIQDEIGDTVKRRRLAQSEFEQPETSPDQEAAFLQQRPTFIAKWVNAVWDSKGSLALLLFVLCIGIVTHRTTTIFIGVVGLIVSVLLFPGFHIFYSQTSRNYARLNKAKVHGRWKEVLECVESLRRSHRLTRIGVSQVELARNRALALAHLGQLDRAITEFQETNNLPDVPYWLHCSHLAGIYDAGHQYEKALEMRLQTTVEKPDMAPAWIDVASTLVRRLNRPTEAWQALARAEKMELTGLGKPYVPFIKGVIHWREGKPSEAKKQLELALEGFRPLAGKPLVEGVILLGKSYLCASTDNLAI